MACLKCGRDTAEGQVFCPDCLAQMTRYPVQPGTIIQIPNRKSSAQRRTAKRRSLTPEEQVKLLRARLRTLTVLFLVVLLLAVGSSALVIRALVPIQKANFSLNGFSSIFSVNFQVRKSVP